MDAAKSQIVARMVKRYITILDSLPTPVNVVFLSDPWRRHFMNMGLTQNATPPDEKSLAYFDAHPILLSPEKLKSLLEKAMATPELNCHIVLFAMHMAQELYAKVTNAAEQHRRAELVLATLPFAKDLNSNILSLY